ncbi:MAG: hypothetical protein OEW08_05340 [Gammaproteobacteria bacterium]|nr:hypothetical protein [Gammaproteobacteria bacterium]
MSFATRKSVLARAPLRIQVDCPLLLQDDSTGYKGEGRCLYISTQSVVFTAKYMPLMGTRVFVQIQPTRAMAIPLDAFVIIRRVESAQDKDVYRITAAIDQVVR